MITRLKPLPDFILWAEFNNGKQTCHRVSELFDRIPAFQDLRNIPGLFEQVRIDPGGYGVSWNDNLDLAAEELFQNGQTVKTSMAQPGECCLTCGQMIRRKSTRQATASRTNGQKGGRPKSILANS